MRVDRSGIDGSVALRTREDGGRHHATRTAAAARPVPKRADPSSPLVSELEFIGCDPLPVNYQQYVLLRESKRRLELWDRAAGTAWELRDGPTAVHEWPIQALHEMAVLMGAVRGIDIPCFGSRGLALLDDDGKRLRVLHPDQSVYLNPPLHYDGHGDIPVQRSGYPDIVMEVDNTTDTRKGKLALYEDMGVPELWIEVPELWREYAGQPLPRRPPGVVPGLTIYLLKGGKYRRHPASRALLGWKAEEIHAALNNLGALSERHSATLEELGRRFGARTGTGPDDHPLLRSMRRQSHETGRAEGLSEGRAEGLSEGRAEGLSEGRAQGLSEGQAMTLRGILERRGVPLSPTFPMDVPNFADVPMATLLDVAMTCDSEQAFREELRRRG